MFQISEPCEVQTYTYRIEGYHSVYKLIKYIISIPNHDHPVAHKTEI